MEQLLYVFDGLSDPAEFSQDVKGHHSKHKKPTSVLWAEDRYNLIYISIEHYVNTEMVISAVSNELYDTTPGKRVV